MLSRALNRSLRQSLLSRVTVRSSLVSRLMPTPAPSTMTRPAARSFFASTRSLQRAADVYSAAHSSPASSGSTPPAGGSHPPSPPPTSGGRHWSEPSGGKEESREDQVARYLRNMSATQPYLLLWAVFLGVLLDWWNSSVAAGGALLTAHEIKALFNELMYLIQREDNLLRAEVVALNENTKRTKEELRQELVEARRDMLAILLNEGRLGGGTGRQLSRLLSSGSGGGGGGDDSEGGWLASFAEKTGLKGGGGGGGRAWERSDKGGGGDAGAWDAGFKSGLRTQLGNLVQSDSGGEKAAQKQQPVVVTDAPAVDDRYKSAMSAQ